jgi:hypothetical protein
MKGGDEAQFHDGKLIQGNRTKLQMKGGMCMA